MGIFRVDFRVYNPAHPEVEEADVRAVVDTGALHLCIPLELGKRLKLTISDYRPVRIADGSVLEVPYAGPVRVELMGRSSYTGALLFGTEALLGAIPLEDMDLHVDARGLQLIPNPASPDRPMSLAVGVLPAGG